MEGQVTKQKLCWNCEARVDFGVENCPSCGVYLSSSPLLEQSTDQLPDNSYISPPYKLVSNEEEQQVPDSPYTMASEEVQEDEEEVVESEYTDAKLDIPFKEWKTEMLPMSFLLGGSVFSLFGIVLLLFSDGGTLTLSWNGNYWYLYTLLGIPLLYFGWKSLEEVPDEQVQSSGGNPH